MGNGYFKYYKSKVLITLIAFLGIAIFLTKEYWGLTISIITTISIFLYIVDKWLWKTKMFSWMFWIENFSGRYEGELEYEYRDDDCKVQKGRLKHVKIIHQSGSKISVFSFTIKTDDTHSTSSENIGIHVKIMKGTNHYQFLYTYLNDGGSGLSTHYGTEIVKYIRKGSKKFLYGRYFTERLPFPTKGTFIELKWVSSNQDHEF